MHADLGFPAFQNASGTIGGELTFRDIISFGFASRIDALKLANGDYYSMIPSFGITVTFKADIKNKSELLKLEERGWNRSEIRTTFLLPLNDRLWAFGGGVNIPLGVVDKTPPEIFIDISAIEKEEDQANTIEGEPVASLHSSNDFPLIQYPEVSYSKGTVKPLSKASKDIVLSGGKKETQKTAVKITEDLEEDRKIVKYISPNNDGIKDDIVIPLNIKDSRYIKGWALYIEDENGSLIKKIENKEDRPETRGVSGFIQSLLSVKTGVKVPESVRWDGTDSDGLTVKDGTYRFFIEAWDDNEPGKKAVYGLVVDNTAPEITITPLTRKISFSL